MTTTMTDHGDGSAHDVCRTCQQNRGWHLANNPRHPFNDGSVSVSQTFGKKLGDGSRAAPTPTGDDAVVTVSAAPWPFDPVLRQALITKGVLTPDDLTQAERTIRAVTATYAATDGGVNHEDPQ